MGDTASEIMAPDQMVPIRGGTDRILVSELTWKASKQFLRELALQAAKFITVDADGTPRFDEGKLVSVILTDLGESLAMATTGQDRAWVDELSLTDMMAVLEKAVALNLRPEMLTHAKNVLAQFRAMLPKTT